jgi:hypothetical protein
MSIDSFFIEYNPVTRHRQPLRSPSQYIDVLRTFVMALSVDELDGRFIVAVELDWMDVVAQIPDLL